MGSPIFPVLATIYMEWFEDAMLKSAPVIPTVWWRYVDDTFGLVHRSNVPQFHAQIYNQEEGIIFTKEEEDERQLPFLDCLISRTPVGGLTSKVYLTTRARKLCSTEESEKAEIRHISKAHQYNNYPQHFIQKCIHGIIPSSSEPQWITSIKLK